MFSVYGDIQDTRAVNLLQITQHAGQSNDLALERHVTLLRKYINNSLPRFFFTKTGILIPEGFNVASEQVKEGISETACSKKIS